MYALLKRFNFTEEGIKQKIKAATKVEVGEAPQSCYLRSWIDLAACMVNAMIWR